MEREPFTKEDYQQKETQKAIAEIAEAFTKTDPHLAAQALRQAITSHPEIPSSNKALVMRQLISMWQYLHQAEGGNESTPSLIGLDAARAEIEEGYALFAQWYAIYASTTTNDSLDADGEATKKALSKLSMDDYLYDDAITYLYNRLAPHCFVEQEKATTADYLLAEHIAQPLAQQKKWPEPEPILTQADIKYAISRLQNVFLNLDWSAFLPYPLDDSAKTAIKDCLATILQSLAFAKHILAATEEDMYKADLSDEVRKKLLYLAYMTNLCEEFFRDHFPLQPKPHKPVAPWTSQPEAVRQAPEFETWAKAKADSSE